MKLVYILFFLLLSLSVSAQNFNGQWKGSFVDNSHSLAGLVSSSVDYVLELECHGSSVTGYSYTYFNEWPKRYYTICKIKGTLDKTDKEIIVTEFERTKYNTPSDFGNCFQTHKLRYSKDSEDAEVLEGTWYPAPNQECGGYGKTSLTRRIIKITPLLPDTKSSTTLVRKNQPFRDMNREPKKPVTIKTNPPTKNQNKNSDIKNQNKKPSNPDQTIVILKKDTAKKDIISIKIPVKKDDQVIVPKEKFEKRANTLLKTIDIEQETFTVDLYDNGEIDGDSVSVFYNGKLLVSHQRLSDKPISLTLTVDLNRTVNELVMYAENLGDIPPNTALMVITDGDKRYEARITSDTERNGTITFRHTK